jgi:hypothetical protein
LASGAGPAAGFCAQAGAYLGGKLDDALSAHQRGYEQQKKQMAAQDAAGYALYAGQHELHHSLNKTMLAIRSETGLSITDIAGRLIRKLLPISNRRPDAAYVGGRPMIAPQYPWYAPALVGNYLKMVRGQYQVNKPAMDAMFADMHSWARKLENAAVAVVLDVKHPSQVRAFTSIIAPTGGPSGLAVAGVLVAAAAGGALGYYGYQRFVA